jgi:RNA polymerase-binding transcription factor DksA
MFTETEATAYRQRLLTFLRRLSSDRSQLKDEALQPAGGEASGGLSDVPLHLADLGSHFFEVDITLDLLDNEEQLIEAINLALARLDQGVYGRCQACQQAIPRVRLQALPYARHCMACARKLQEKAARVAIRLATPNGR